MRINLDILKKEALSGTMCQEEPPARFYKVDGDFGRLFDVITMLFQVYFRQLSATDTVLDAKHNGFQSVITINMLSPYSKWLGLLSLTSDFKSGKFLGLFLYFSILVADVGTGILLINLYAPR